MISGQPLRGRRPLYVIYAYSKEQPATDVPCPRSSAASALDDSILVYSRKLCRGRDVPCLGSSPEKGTDSPSLIPRPMRDGTTTTPSHPTA